MIVAGSVDDDDDDSKNHQSQEFSHDDANCALSAAGQPTNFVKHFSTSNGPPQVLFICFMLALASGCTVGVIPAVMTDRFARKNHDYDGMDCFAFSTVEKPPQCRQGSQDAQNFSAVSSFISNMITFFTSALVGSFSDRHGRRGVIVVGMFLSLLSPFSLMLMQLYVTMSPMWYYMANPISSLVSWSAVTLSSLSDVIPPKWRAPSFGLLLASFMLGFALSPLLAVTLSHWSISIISLMMHVVILAFAVFFLPETLPPCARRRQNKSEDLLAEKKPKINPRVISVLLAPFQELSILNRNYLFRLLSVLAFFSGMVSSADQSLLVYYAEDQFNFNDHDIATMFAVFGILGIVIQGVVMKLLNDCLGERRVVIVAFTFGVIHNIIYGLATSKFEILVGVALGCFVSMSFPTISAMKSNNAGKIEQGRIQGALVSLSSLASAVGPASLRIVYHLTSDTKYPGSMFLFASFLYFIAVLCAYALPDVVTEHNEIDEIYLKLNSSFDDPTNLDDSFTSCSSYHNYGSLEILRKPLLTDMQFQTL